jgi:hypothetical protein
VDLSAMTEPQARALVDATTGRLCVFVRCRPDGSAIFRSASLVLSLATAACAVGRRQAPDPPAMHEPAETEPASEVSVEDPADGDSTRAPDSSTFEEQCCSGLGLGCMGLIAGPPCPGERDPFDGEAAAAALAASARPQE